jgi:WD40 repeat protein
MNSPDVETDDSFTARLAAHDAALATGETTPDQSSDDSELRSAKSFLDLLESVWQRQDRFAPVERNSPETLADAPAARLGRFEILQELGRGGGGIVYLAKDPTLNRQVAIKVPRPESFLTQDLLLRFLREAEAAAQLNHRHVVPILEVGEVGGICYIVTQYCSGPNLAHWLRERVVPSWQAATIVALLSDGVTHMHSRGILHRDIKPSNVLLDTADEGDQGPLGFVPRLTDFGLAKIECIPSGDSVGPDDGLTRMGTIIGTPQYMAPEQAEGRLDSIGPATDVYALGVVLYEMLVGRPPFHGETTVATLQQAAKDQPVSVRLLRRDVPRDLETICLKCLAKRPGERYATAAGLAADLRNFLEGRPTVARPLPPMQRIIRWALRHPAPAALIANAFLAVIGGVLGIARYAMEQEEHNVELRRMNDQLEETVRREREQRRVVEDRDRELRLNNYADRLSRAADAWSRGQPTQAIEWLNDLRPRAGEPDLRGYEWYHLRSLCHPIHDVWSGHRGGICCVAAAPDGKTVASASRDETVRIWDVNSGRTVATLPGAMDGPRSLAFSPDGRALALAYDSGGVGHSILWDVPTYHMRTRTRIAPVEMIHGAFTPDSQTFGVSTWHGLGLWDVTTGQQRAFYPKKDVFTRTIEFAPGGGILLTSDSNSVSLWDVLTGREIRRMTGDFGDVESIAWSPDGQTIALNGSETDKTLVRLLDAATGTQRVTLSHPFNVTVISFSADSRSLVCASKNNQQGTGEVRLWDAAQGKPLATFAQHLDQVHAMALVPHTELVALGCEDRTIKLLHTGHVQVTKQLSGHTPAETWSLAFAPDGRTLASAGDDHQVRLWDPMTGQQRKVLAGHTSLVTAVAYSRDGKTLASASYDGSVKLWDVANGSLINALPAPEQKLRCLALSPDGNIVAAGTRTTQSGEVRLWDIRTGRALPSLGGHEKTVRGVAFSPDGSLLASASEDGKIRWWYTATWELKGQAHDTHPVDCLAFAPDGKTLVAGNGSGTIRSWEMPSGREKATFRGHLGEVFSVAFSLDGRTLSSASYDKTVRLWQAETTQELMVLDGHITRVNAVAFAPDCRTLASASHDGAIMLRHAP